MGSWPVLALVHGMFQNSHAETEGTPHTRIFYTHIVPCLHGLKAVNTFRNKQSRGGNPTVIPAVRALKMTEADRTCRYPDEKVHGLWVCTTSLNPAGAPRAMHRYSSEGSAAGWELLQQMGKRRRLHGELRASSSTYRCWRGNSNRGME